jgi:hypothetical protein
LLGWSYETGGLLPVSTTEATSRSLCDARCARLPGTRFAPLLRGPRARRGDLRFGGQVTVDSQLRCHIAVL